MADQTIPPPPPGFKLDAPQSGPIYGLPLHPTPQTPDQATGQALQNQHTQQEISSQPLQNESTSANIQQSRSSVQNQRFGQNQGLRQEFNNLPEVKNYSVALQSLGTALNAPDTPQGDLGIIYAYAKAADPGSVVREGEMDMATATASIPEQYRASAMRLTQGQRLPPEVRTGLIEAMRHSVAGLRQVYDQQYSRYGQLAQQNGFDPIQVVGHPLYDAYRPMEERYIQAHGSTPRDPNASQQPQGQGDIGFNTPAQKKNPFTPEQQTAYDAFLKANPQATKDQFASFLHSIGQPLPVNADNILDALHKGNGYQPADTATTQQDPRVTAEIQRRMANRQGEGNSALIGAATDIPFINHITAGVDAAAHTLSGQGNGFGDNYGVALDSVTGYEKALRDQNFKSYTAGQLGGALLLPTGEVSGAADLAKVGAAYGAAQGADQSNAQDGVAGTLKNAAIGGAAGAALGYVAPKVTGVFKGKPAEVPPLVDPQTGQLNQPLEAMTPGQRVVKAEEYGINLPADAAGGRTAAIIGKGLDINPGSAGVMEDARRATESQVAGASDVVASRFGSSRTLNEAGAELQRGANERIQRGKGVISKAYNAIPISDQAPASTSNAVSTLQTLTGRLQSNPDLAAAMQDPKLLRYQSALQRGGLTWQDLKDFRSIIGEKIGDYRFGEGHSTKDLRALYAGLSEDMKNTAAAQGPGALRAFERANNLNRQNQDLIDGALTRILGKNSNGKPEDAATAVAAMTMGGKSTGDLRTLAQIKAATSKSGAWNEIASTLIRLGGQPAKSAGRDFSPTTFVNWYADMAEPARQMLFGDASSDLRKALDGFVAVSQRLQKVNALRNASNTAGGLVAAGTAAGMTAPLTMAAMGHPGAALITAGGEGLTALSGYGMAKLWTNPGFVRLMTGYSKAVASGSQSAVKSQIGRIAALAATNPDLREPLVALQQRLLNAANDNASRPAVASNSNTEEGQQGK